MKKYVMIQNFVVNEKNKESLRKQMICDKKIQIYKSQQELLNQIRIAKENLELQEKIELLELKIEKCKKKIENIMPYSRNDLLISKTMIEINNSRKSTLTKRTNQKAKITKIYWQLQEKQNYIDKKIEEIKNEIQISIANKNKIHKIERKNYWACRYQQTSNKMPLELLESYLPVLQNNCNMILENISDFRIKLERSKDNVEIFLARNGMNDYKVQLGCNFEKFVIGIAFRISLTEHTQTARPGFLLIDEGFDCADTDNLQNVPILLQKIVENYKHLLLISHISEIKSACDHNIDIVKKGNVSLVL